jgi:hypothetical protein
MAVFAKNVSIDLDNCRYGFTKEFYVKKIQKKHTSIPCF